MTTVEMARNEDTWEIQGKLVNKRVFCTHSKDNKPLRLMSLTLIDTDGTLFDIQSWSINQFYCLYRKMIPNEDFVITGSGPLHEPDKKYSTSKYLIKGRWWIERLDKRIRLRKYISCSINLDKTISTLKSRPENVLGVFVDLTLKQSKNNSRPFLQGYYVKLLDNEGRLFRALVWHVNYIKGNPFPLDDAQKGDDVLITCMRPSFVDPSAEGDDRVYTLTSIVPPVLNSECVSNRRRQDLKQ